MHMMHFACLIIRYPPDRCLSFALGFAISLDDQAAKELCLLRFRTYNEIHGFKALRSFAGLKMSVVLESNFGWESTSTSVDIRVGLGRS
jgi:hypothetical protein